MGPLQHATVWCKVFELELDKKEAAIKRNLLGTIHAHDLVLLGLAAITIVGPVPVAIL
jgi:hypothetical protein